MAVLQTDLLELEKLSPGLGPWPPPPEKFPGESRRSAFALPRRQKTRDRLSTVFLSVCAYSCAGRRRTDGRPFSKDNKGEFVSIIVVGLTSLDVPAADCLRALGGGFVQTVAEAANERVKWDEREEEDREGMHKTLSSSFSLLLTLLHRRALLLNLFRRPR